MAAVAEDGQEEERRLEAVRVEAARIAREISTASQAVSVALYQHDDHKLIAALRKALACGLRSKDLADQLHAALPQNTRLFEP